MVLGSENWITHTAVTQVSAYGHRIVTAGQQGVGVGVGLDVSKEDSRL